MLRKKPQGAREAAKQTNNVEILASRLLPLLLEGIEERDRVTVLDLGSGAQSTVDFFSGYNARLHFADLYSFPVMTAAPDELDTAKACAAIENYLHLPEDVSFDVCLFWDVLHFQSTVVLEGLSRALAPHLNQRSVGYGFGSLPSGARMIGQEDAGAVTHYRYSVEDDCHLRLRPAELNSPYYSHTQQDLDEYFPALSIQKATLLREGRLELLFSRS